MKKIRIICIFLLGVLSYSAKSDELKKYFSKEIELPVYDYLSLSKDYSFDNEIVVNDTAVLSSAVTDPANEVHATYGKPQGNGVDEMNIWGCYFFMEALHRMLDPDWKLYW